MTGLDRILPKRAWLRTYRLAGLITLLSTALSVILTNAIMEGFSEGINLPGLAVAILTPLILGGPASFFLVFQYERLRHAHAQLERIASTDWLTTCLNRGAFTAAVSRHLSGLSAGDDAVLLIVDADDFKSVNDRFGHGGGDEALRLIAQAIRNTVRDRDLVGRLGGEEFGVLLANSDLARADHVAEQIRRAVADIDFAPDGVPCPLSVSIGGATYASGTPLDQLYRQADHHLYEAKNKGRDRVAMPQAA